MERCREQKDMHMVFIDLGKAYEKIPRTVMWLALEQYKVRTKYSTTDLEEATKVVSTRS
jgi:hypothetical protein